MESEDHLNVETASIDSTGPMNMDDEDNDRAGPDHGSANTGGYKAAHNPGSARFGGHHPQGLPPRQNKAWQQVSRWKKSS